MLDKKSMWLIHKRLINTEIKTLPRHNVVYEPDFQESWYGVGICDTCGFVIIEI